MNFLIINDYFQMIRTFVLIYSYLLLAKFNQKNSPKNKKLFLGIKSGAKGSKIQLFWVGFSYFGMRNISRDLNKIHI